MCSFVRKHLFLCRVNIFMFFKEKFLISLRNPIIGDLTVLYIQILPRNVVSHELLLMILMKELI